MLVLLYFVSQLMRVHLGTFLQFIVLFVHERLLALKKNQL